MDYHRNSDHTMAARLFRSEHQPKLPAIRRLGPYSDCHRCDPHHIAPTWDRINPSAFNDDWGWSLQIIKPHHKDLPPGSMIRVADTIAEDLI